MPLVACSLVILSVISSRNPCSEPRFVFGQVTDRGRRCLARWWKVAVVVGVLLVGCWFLLHPRDRLSSVDLPTADSFASGDIVLLSSETCRGKLVRLADFGETYAHVGLIDVEGDVVWLIHADPAVKRVTREPLAAYLEANLTTGMMLLRVDSPKGDRAVRIARAMASSHTPFDDDFHYGEGEGVYCTELVLRAWAESGVVLLPDVKRGDSVFPARVREATLCREKWKCDVGSRKESASERK